jgi:hypothetical protein
MAAAIKLKEHSAVTPNRIAQAKARATQLCNAAYAAQPIPQPGGAVLPLCWNGRITRGYERLAAARIAKNEAQIRVLENAIKGLEEQYNAAAREAEAAASEWAALAALAGEAAHPHDVYPPQCECEGCRLQMTLHDHNEARGAYSDALYAFLAPMPEDTPPVLELLKDFQFEERRDRFWGYLKRIYESGNAYADACKQAGVRPNWRAALFPGE